MVILRTNSGRKIIVEGSLQQIKDQVFNSLGGFLYPFTDENKLNDQTMFDSPMFGTHTGERDAINPVDIEEYSQDFNTHGRFTATFNENGVVSGFTRESLPEPTQEEVANGKQSKNRK